MGFCNCSMFLLCVTLCLFLFCNHLDGEERVSCFVLCVFLVSRDCCVALPYAPCICLQFVTVVFPDHTHYFWDTSLYMSKGIRFEFS